MKQKILYLLSIFMLLFSCSDGDNKLKEIEKEAIIIIHNEDITTLHPERMFEVLFETNMDWIAKSSESWCKIFPSMGERSNKGTTITVSENKTDKDRTCTLTITVGNKSKSISITQKGYSATYTVEKMGTLETLFIPGMRDTITTMALKGEINRSDFMVLKNNFPNLLHLDLSEVKCENRVIPYEAFGAKVNFKVDESWEYSIYLEQANRKIKTVILPKNITTIEEAAFAGCSELSKIVFHDNSVTTIEDVAFLMCTSLTDPLNLPDGLNTIGDMAFFKCSGLTGSLTLPETLENIGAYAFYNCSGFSGSLTLPKSMTHIGSRAFSECTGFTGSLTFPEGLENIGADAFYNCSGFSGSLTLPKSMTHIESGAFSECTGFTGSLTIPEGLENIGAYTFHNCSNFTSLTIPEGLTHIKSYAFYNCTNITGKVVLPKSLQSIEKGGFYQCCNVEVFKIPLRKPIPYTSLMFPRNAVLEVPMDAVDNYESTAGWENHTMVGY